MKQATKHRSIAKALARLQELEDQSKAKRAAAGITDDEIRKAKKEAEDIALEVRAADAKAATAARRRGTSSARLIERAQLKLFEGEQRGDFSQFPIDASSEYPSLLTRLPLFVPAQRSTVQKRLDQFLSMPFCTGW
ncbi:MAG: hypothetical protein AAFO01_21235, partial [Pseudomonadota bacterium]